MPDDLTANPFTTTSVPAALPPVAAPMARPDPRSAPGQGLLQMLLHLQQADPQRFAMMLAGHRAQQFGITPENLAGMQSRQDMMHDWRAMQPGMLHPGGMGGPVAPIVPAPAPAPVTPAVMPGAMPINPAAHMGGGGWNGGAWGGFRPAGPGPQNY